MKRVVFSVIIFIFTVMYSGIGDGPQAKIEVRHNFNKSGAAGPIKVLSHFVTRYNDAKNAKPLNEFCNGSTVHFYYKVGPVRSIKGKGMPFRTRMVVEVLTRNGKKRKDLGWKKGNGVNRAMMNKTKTFGYYHSARWNLNLSSNIEPGADYTITIYHKDLNSRKTLTMKYKFRTRMCE